MKLLTAAEARKQTAEHADDDRISAAIAALNRRIKARSAAGHKSMTAGVGDESEELNALTSHERDHLLQALRDAGYVVALCGFPYFTVAWEEER